MKKASIAVLLFALCGALITSISMSNTSVDDMLSRKVWKFKAVDSDNLYTVHYLATLYGDSRYQFAKDNTYTGTFFELPIKGTWEVSDHTLVLNKGTYKEESYTLTMPSAGNLILETTEKNHKVIIEFEAENR